MSVRLSNVTRRSGSHNARRALFVSIAVLGTALALTTGALASRASSASSCDTASSAAGCGGLKGLITAAKKEGTLNVIALPNNWANYGTMLNTFHQKYGIKIVSENPDGSSAQEIDAIKNTKGRSSAPDVVDVGLAFAVRRRHPGSVLAVQGRDLEEHPEQPEALERPVLPGLRRVHLVRLQHEPARLDAVPDDVGGAQAAKYHNDVALNGSPLSANAALSAVWAASVNNGGSANSIKQGVDFFHQLKSLGNFNSTDCNAAAVIATSCPITINWDYLNTAGAWGLSGATHWKVVDPTGTPFGGFYAQAVSKYAAHPAAARLWEEFLYSAQGQNIWLKGGARPVELGAMVKAGTANKAALKALPAVSNLSKAVIPTVAQSTDCGHVPLDELVSDRSTERILRIYLPVPRRLGAAGSARVSAPVSGAGPGSCRSRRTSSCSSGSRCTWSSTGR